jgi:methylated-DNA-[protein]-cysteine S-methyltransferase
VEKPVHNPATPDAACGVAHVCTIQTPLGPMVAASTPMGALAQRGICFLEFDTDERRAGERIGKTTHGAPEVEHRRDECLALLEEELAGYFAGRVREFSVPLALRGTEFQAAVWAQLRRIRYGETVSYSDLAARLGMKNGQRAVGLANGRNPVAIVVPCHRVIERGGGLGGYGGGLERKRLLLELERGSLFQGGS